MNPVPRVVLFAFPPETLRQVVPDCGPAELLGAHEAAIDQMARRGLRPDRFHDDDEVLRLVRATEEQALRQVRIPSLASLLARELSTDVDDPALGDDETSRLRVDAWLAAGVT